MVQNSMVMAFLSYADFYRPRYFLLENVRNFVSHNKSFTFRLTLRSLLDMGYQVGSAVRLPAGLLKCCMPHESKMKHHHADTLRIVHFHNELGMAASPAAESNALPVPNVLFSPCMQVRFGVLNAGNFGVAQSRKRTFIWAARPGAYLPDWPTLQHVFRSPQLTINLPGGVAYTAAPQTNNGAPLRPITVRDAIGDLPPIENGADRCVRMRGAGDLEAQAPILVLQNTINTRCDK